MIRRTVSDPAQELQQLERRLERFESACGCESGAVAMLSALILYPVYLAQGRGDLWPLTIGEVAAGVGVIVAAAVAGKLAGVAWARLSLRRTRDRIRELAPGRA
jgi:hypothetical protein